MKPTFVNVLVLLLASLIRMIAPASASAEDTVAFIHVNVVPMDSERVAKDQTVVVTNGRIVEIGPAHKVKVTEGALTIDGKDKYLMPGLVDMHAHLNSPREFPLYLANGVTTVYNLNGRPAHLMWRERVRNGQMLGPNIYTCGPTIRRADKADEARRIVEEQSKAGYDSIKIYNDISIEAYPVLVDTARRHGMLVVGHIPRPPGLEGVLKARQAIAHAEEYIYTFFKDRVDDRARIPEAVAATRKADVPVILTLVAYDHILRQAEDLPRFLARPETKYLAPWVRESWGPGVNIYNQRFRSPERQQYLRNGLAFQKELVKALHAAGVRIFVGTDAMNPGVVPGFSAIEELHNINEIGFNPFEAIQAATRLPAEFLCPEGKFGTVEVGKSADLLLVSRNPLADLTAVDRPAGVMARGRWLPESQLRAMLDAVPAEYETEEEYVKANIERDAGRVVQYLDENDPFENLSGQLAFDIVLDGSIPKLMKLYGELKKTRPNAAVLQEQAMNSLGYKLLQRDKKAAIEVFKLNVEAHPKSANVYDSLAEAYLTTGDKDLAIKFYKKAVEVDPLFRNAADMLKKIEHGGTAK
jgi:hypothetical protein